MADLEAGPDDKPLAGDIELLPPHLRRAALQKVRSRFPDARPIRETILYEERTSFEEERPAARAACTRPTAIPTAT
ncbi:MAG: hypothetical protein ACOZB1_04095 [Pseudomonadota bacterium]|jgi:hypothetical protein